MHTQAQNLIAILGDIVAERTKQDQRWGRQHHADGTGGEDVRAETQRMRARCDFLDREGDVNWATILLEEVYEALCETDPEKLAEELTQVAAVTVAWLEDLRERD